MRDDSWHEAVGQHTLALQIIVAALVAGVLFFLTIVVVVLRPEIRPPGILTAFAAAVAGAMLIARTVVPHVLVTMARRRLAEDTPQDSSRGRQGSQGQDTVQEDDVPRLLAVLQQKTIAGAAMLEGGAFFATIVYMMEGSPLCIAFAVVLLLGIAAHFPTRARVTDWVQRQLELLEQERPFHGTG